jgi:molecular chaperone DnaJ
VRGAAGGGQGFDPTVFNGFEDILGGLGDIFGFGDVFGGGRRRSGPQRGADLRYDLEITFDQSAKGAETTIQIPRHESCGTCSGSGAAPGTQATACGQCRGSGQIRFQQGFFTMARTCGTCRGSGKVIATPCKTCRGEGQIEQQKKLSVKIPAGIASGQRLRLSGEGEGGMRGGPPGDLYVVIFVQDDERFTRDGNDLHASTDVWFTTLALGGEIQVPGIDGEHALKIPEGTVTGSVFRLRGKGMPDVSGRGKGDLMITVRGTTPSSLSKEQRKLLEQLAATFDPDSQGETRDEDKGLFGKVKDIFG